MGLKITVNGAPVPQPWGGRFFAIRIGAGQANEIVVADNTPGVQEHHCTIVHTGSSYRLEMLPTHLVFVDGERGECGQQLFLRNTETCVLSIGGAPLARRAADDAKMAPSRLAPPPRIVLEKTERSVFVPQRPDQKGKTNRDISRFARISIRNLAIGVATVALLGGSASAALWWQSDQLAHRLKDLSSLSSAVPSAGAMAEAQKAVFQIGLVNEETHVFAPTGTAWLWDPTGKARSAPTDAEPWRLVTNIHVVDAIDTCASTNTAEAAEKCKGTQSGRPALRYFSQQADGPKEQVVPLTCGAAPTAISGQPDAPVALKHADYDTFNHWLRAAQQPLDLPNIYDIATLDWPGACMAQRGWQGAPLVVSEGLSGGGKRPGAGLGVAILGYPAEGEAVFDTSAARAQFRPGWIGRTSDPFGLPAKEEDLLVLTGPEVVGGESGSPIIDSNGQVVAMVFANFSQRPDRAAPRISFGGRMKALSARLLLERDRFAKGSAPLEPTPARLEEWKNGLMRQTVDRKRLVLQKFNDWKCPKGVAHRAMQPFDAKAEQSASFPQDGGFKATHGWAWSGATTLSGQPGYAANLLLIATSIDETPREVIVSASAGASAPYMASSDPTTTLASAPGTPDDAFIAFSEQQPSRQVSYMVFSPEAQGKGARFAVELHTIECRPETTP